MALALLCATPGLLLGGTAHELDGVVVTGSRTAGHLSDEPQAITVLTEEDIAATAADDLTDILKKRTGVDVIQYPGLLSGIGLRGFRPQFSGINQRTLTLYDDRPAGATNLSLISPSGIERIEVLRGPASSVYGSSAMAGVVNVIPRRKTGPWESHLQLGYGSFDRREAELVTGGSIGDRADLTIGLGAREQRDDFRMGNGDRRDHTSHRKYDANLRFGAQLAPDWWLELSGEGTLARDVETPGDIAYGTSQQGMKDIDRYSGEARVTGFLGDHELTALVYGARESDERMNVDDGEPTYRSSAGDIDWRGLQLKDTWRWAHGQRLTMGMDYQTVEQGRRSYNEDGDREAPHSADSQRDTTGVFARQQSRLPTDTVVTLGARHDWIEVETLETAHKDDFEPGSARFTTFNPSFGLTHPLGRYWHLRGSIGTAFMVPDAGELTGESETERGGRTDITRGNPDLDPERSLTWDVGVDFMRGPWAVHASYFNTRVRDRIVRITVDDPDDQSEPRIFSFDNADRARFHGLELEARYRPNDVVGLFGTVTRILSAREEVDGQERDSLNVASWNVNTGVNLNVGTVDGQLLLRYVGPRKDQDWVNNPGAVVEDGGFTIVDVSAGWRPAPNHRVSLEVANALDRHYFEKRGFPLPGRTVTARYRHDF